MRKLLFGIGVCVAVIAVLPLFAAFEAHVVNATASIDNVLEASAYSLNFGTVFPQEKFDKTFDISLSQSFQLAERYDDVEYVLRQKPKCQRNQEASDQLPTFGQVMEDEDGNFVCSDSQHYHLMPFLCPYLSKQEITSDGIALGGENDMTVPPGGHEGPLASFHGPIMLAPFPNGWNMNTTIQYQLAGRLAKSEQDISDSWNIDLKVPCFGNQCAQDWADFVAANDGDNNANPADYIQPTENEHKLFGCDLWVEVTGLSDPIGLTLKKEVVKDNGGNADASDWTLSAQGPVTVSGSGPEVVSGAIPPGTYTLSESGGPQGYSPSVWNCTDGVLVEDQLTLASGDSATCTITNDDQQGTFNVVKVVEGGQANPEDFTFQVNGGTAVSFEADGTNGLVLDAGTYTVSEPAVANYTATYSNSVNADANCDDLPLTNGGSVTCTITNTYNPQPVSFFSDNFGTGDSVNDVPNWDEAGSNGANGTIAKSPTSDNNSASPDGGRFALIDGGGWICRSVNATGYNTLVLKYYWRGDIDAEDNEYGFVEYATGGTCAAPTGLTTLATHELDDGNTGTSSWSALQSIGLPGSLNGTTFLLRFRDAANANDESFRIDGVSITGIPN